MILISPTKITLLSSDFTSIADFSILFGPAFTVSVPPIKEILLSAYNAPPVPSPIAVTSPSVIVILSADNAVLLLSLAATAVRLPPFTAIVSAIICSVLLVPPETMTFAASILPVVLLPRTISRLVSSSLEMFPQVTPHNAAETPFFNIILTFALSATNSKV